MLPRRDGLRRLDTTVVGTTGKVSIDPQDRARLEELWHPFGEDYTGATAAFDQTGADALKKANRLARWRWRSPSWRDFRSLGRPGRSDRPVAVCTFECLSMHGEPLARATRLDE
jgi:hypothetical protein